jgi:hypothetical protein
VGGGWEGRTAAEATETAVGAILRLICVGVREVGECRRCWWNFYNVTIFQMTISNDLGKLSKQTIHYWLRNPFIEEGIKLSDYRLSDVGKQLSMPICPAFLLNF